MLITPPRSGINLGEAVFLGISYNTTATLILLYKFTAWRVNSTLNFTRKTDIPRIAKRWAKPNVFDYILWAAPVCKQRNPKFSFRPEFFFRLLFHNCISCVCNCDHKSEVHIKVNVFSRTLEYEWFPQIVWNCAHFNWRFGKYSFSVNAFISKVFSS